MELVGRERHAVVLVVSMGFLCLVVSGIFIPFPVGNPCSGTVRR